MINKNKIINNLYRFILLTCLIGLFWSVYKISSRKQSYTNRANSQNIELKKNDASFPRNNSEVIITNPTFTGINQDMLPYEISAHKATQVSKDELILHSASGKYRAIEGDFFIKANEAILNKNNINLTGDISVSRNDLSINAIKMNINLIAKDIISNSAVRVNMNNSTIDADSFVLDNAKHKIHFNGNVYTKINISDL